MLVKEQTSAEFRALGTYVFVGVSDPSALDPAVEITREALVLVDQTCSRFRDDSDLRRVNARAGTWTEVHPLLVAAVRAALAVAHDTDGLIDPLLGRSMVSLGYDKDFRSLAPSHQPPVAARPDAWREIAVGDGALRIPRGTALDLGSIGKAFASDLVAQALESQHGIDALISVGGDIALAGAGEWPVDISEHPGGPAEQTVWIKNSGLATSSTQVRRWQSNGAQRHHILDPRTGQPAPEVWRTVSAIGRTCVAANAASTAAIVLGEQAPAWLKSREVSARLVAINGQVRRTCLWPEETTHE